MNAGSSSTAVALARSADAHELSLEALFAYECACTRGEATVEDQLSLVALYVSLLDFGFAESARAPRSLRDMAFPRVMELLDVLGLERDIAPEVHFWKVEARNVAFGEVPNLEELRSSANEAGSESLSLLLALGTAGREGLPMATEFLLHTSEYSARGRYFRSLGSGLAGLLPRA